MSRQRFRLAPYAVILGLVSVGLPCWVGLGQDDQGKPAREDEVSQLIDLIRDATIQESDPDCVLKAILRLGDMKATEAIDDLARLLTFRKWLPHEKDPSAPKSEDHIVTPARRYPAISALRQIGPPALPALIKVIAAHEPNSLETQNAMEVIIGLSRYERPAYVQKLKDAAATASSVEAIQRLLEAAETLEHTKR